MKSGMGFHLRLEMKEITNYITSLNGNKVYFKFRDDIPIYKIKTALCQREGRPLTNMRLLVDGYAVNENLSSMDLGIDNDTKIVLVEVEYFY